MVSVNLVAAVDNEKSQALFKEQSVSASPQKHRGAEGQYDHSSTHNRKTGVEANPVNDVA